MFNFKNIHNTSVQFEVKEYGKYVIIYLFFFFVHVLYKLIPIYIFYDLSVLPKFSVKLTVPPYILKTDNKIQINITTR